MIPLGPKGGRRIAPVATLAIIGINSIVYLATLSAVDDQTRRLVSAETSLAAIETTIEVQRLGISPQHAMRKWYGGEQHDARETDFWAAFDAGRIVPFESPEAAAWQAARQEVAQSRDAHLWWRYAFRARAPSAVALITSAFLHAGFAHILFNMIFLWAVGPSIEAAWGRSMFLALYALGIVLSTLANWALTVGHADIPSLGASGAIAAVMGAFTIRFFREPIRIYSFLPAPAIYELPGGWLLAAWIAEQLYAAGRTGPGDGGGVAVWAHVGGFAAGAALAGVIRITRFEERELKGRVDIVERSTVKRRLLEEADLNVKRGATADALAALEKATEADPSDVDVRARKQELQRLSGDLAGARAEGERVLEALWRAGDKARFMEAFARQEALAEGQVPHALTLRAAMAREAREPLEAARLYVKVAREGGADPAVPQALRRYAALLDRLGEAEKAAQVRRRLDALHPGA